MKKDMINYSKLVDEAMHIIVFKVLKKVEQEGLPGEHHFFISFMTKGKGVKISESLIHKYPHEMTIVLQYQYQDLKVDSKGFSITLFFNGSKENIYIPYASISSFADPSVQFGLQFREVEYDYEDFELDKEEKSINNIRGNSTTSVATSTNNVISFESLRRHHYDK